MSARTTISKPSSTKLGSGGWRLAVFFVGWTALVVVAVAWLVGDAANLEDKVIRVGPGEAKAWVDRLDETVALARLNFPWALAWFFLTPYALWVGVRYSLDAASWRRRLPVLLATGAAFICASQWLAHRLVAGQRMIVMVRYSTDSALETRPPTGELPVHHSPQSPLTNRVASNRMTKVIISEEATPSAKPLSWETATREILSGAGTNFEEVLARHTLEDLPQPKQPRSSRWSAVLDAFAFVALVGLAHAGVFHRRYREREQQASLLESRLNQARLRALQAQLQPHFLFNTLNGIATLLRRDPATAGEMLQSLSELLRIALSTSDRQEITLREELDFLSRYLAIQRMRFGDRLSVVEEIEPTTLECLVPALLLQPLVENAIRHGLEPSDQPGELRLAAAREGDRVRLTVEDDGVGFSSDPEREKSGVGLANVRERLTTLYGDSQEIQITERPAGGVSVVIRLPARTESQAAAAERKEAVAE